MLETHSDQQNAATKLEKQGHGVQQASEPTAHHCAHHYTQQEEGSKGTCYPTPSFIVISGPLQDASDLRHLGLEHGLQILSLGFDMAPELGSL